MRKLNELRVPFGTLLLSRSGTVAIPVLVSKRLSLFAITDDAIRVACGALRPGYLYAYLSSWIGRALVRKNQYGVTIKHLEAPHLLAAECPLLPDNEQQAIHDEILRAYALRDEANQLLDEADELLHQELGLPHFDESLVPYLPTPPRPSTNRPEMPHPKAFNISALELGERLDASFHVPVARTAIDLLQKGKYVPVPLRKVTDRIFIPTRFKRIYVAKEYGVPFLQGSHLSQMRPYELKYLSKNANAKHIDQCVVQPGYVLVTRSGTVGRVGLVSSLQVGWGASEHLLRIVPDPRKGHPGYIAAFLMTSYGQHQLTAKIYGGVVDEITEEDTGAVWIPDAPADRQLAVGQYVVTAFEKRDEANKIEEIAIQRLENALQNR